MTITNEIKYLQLLDRVMTHGNRRSDRTGTGTISLFGEQVNYDLSQGFPLLTTKRLSFHSIKHELLWFLRGDTNTKYLEDNHVTIWREWADENGDLGPIYGKQWRSWQLPNGDTIDQIVDAETMIKTDPSSRRIIVSAWNVADLPFMALPPCHLLFQFYVNGDRLDCQLYQRSADLFLGVPYNIASYALLTTMMASVCGLRPGTFVHTLGDVHIYENHVEQVKAQLGRQPLDAPTVTVDPDVKSIVSFKSADIKLSDYYCHSPIPAPVAV